MTRHAPTRGRRLFRAAITLVIVGTAALCTGCDPFGSHAAAFSAGYLLGRWEATRVEIVRTERVCLQNDIQVPCPPTD